jgi:hypothetical protein
MYTINELTKMTSLDLAMLVLDQQKLLQECQEILAEAINTLESVKEDLQ